MHSGHRRHRCARLGEGHPRGGKSNAGQNRTDPSMEHDRECTRLGPGGASCRAPWLIQLAQAAGHVLIFTGEAQSFVHVTRAFSLIDSDA